MSDQTDNAMDPNSLYREENFTDQKLGAIRKLIPVNSDGSDDKDREVMFFWISPSNDTYGCPAPQFCT